MDFHAILLSAQSTIVEKATQSLKNIFGDSILITQTNLLLTEDDRQKIIDRLKGQAATESVSVYCCKMNDKTVGYGFVDNVKGKTQLITYLVALQPDGTMEDVDVLAYREAYGGEIANDSFRRQFRQKTIDDKLRPGNDIKNISGATISVRAITHGVKKVLTIFDVMKSRLQ